jgi:hypothetical protein
MTPRRLHSILCVVLAIASAALAAPACGKTGESGLGGATTGSASGGGGFGGSDEDCDSKESNCGDATSGCIACAEASPHACRNQLNVCNSSLECREYGQCIEKCAQGDDACVSDCASMFPYGSSTYQELLDCVICKHCPVKCNAPGSGCGV